MLRLCFLPSDSTNIILILVKDNGIGLSSPRKVPELPLEARGVTQEHQASNSYVLGEVFIPCTIVLAPFSFKRKRLGRKDAARLAQGNFPIQWVRFWGV